MNQDAPDTAPLVCFLGDAASIHVQRLVGLAADCGLRTVTLSFRQPPPGALPGRTVLLSRHPRLGRADYLLQLPRTRRLIRRLRPAAVHAVYATSYGLLAAAAGHHPMVITALGTDVLVAPRNPALRRMLRWSLGRADLLTATSPFLCQATAAIAGSECTLIPLWVDTELFRPLPRTGPNGPVIGTVRGLHWLYGLDTLIRAFDRVRREHPDARLVIVGEGEQRAELEDLVAQLGLGAAVDLHGAIPNSEVPAMLASIDVFAIPSRSEGLGVAALEAMACGKAVVASTAGNLPYLVRDGETGLTAPVDDVPALAAALSRVLADGELRLGLGAAARAEAELHTRDRSLQAFRDAYRAAGILST